MEHITLIFFFCLAEKYLVHLFLCLRACGGSACPSARRALQEVLRASMLGLLARAHCFFLG